MVLLTDYVLYLHSYIPHNQTFIKVILHTSTVFCHVKVCTVAHKNVNNSKYNLKKHILIFIPQGIEIV